MADVLQAMSATMVADAREKLERPVNPKYIKVSKVNKFGSGEYLPVGVYKKLLNEIFGYAWSWEIISKELHEHPKDKFYVEVLGRLTIPGIGVKEAYGSQPILEPNQWAQSAKMAASYALKNACKMVGVGDLEEDDDLFGGDDSAGKAQGQAQGQTQKAQVSNAGPSHDAGNAQTQVKAKATFTDAQIQAMGELKAKYKIADNKQLVPFIKAWNPAFEKVSDLTGDNIDGFIQWMHTNADNLGRELD